MPSTTLRRWVLDLLSELDVEFAQAFKVRTLNSTRASVLPIAATFLSAEDEGVDWM
jgi:hypothetical protein